ncbi:MAG: insulinase family protein [Planctomycetota bacterium]|nr:MAG: insulinase family protein [Planctomycetota bacterium]
MPANLLTLGLLSTDWVGVSTLQAAPPTLVTTVEGVSEYRFDNGARLLLFPDASRPTISVNMTVLVGSRHEGYGEAGMAHLLEHLVFKGTPTFPDVPKALRDHGASFNGTTNVDRTNYFETLPATDENLDFGIHLECDRLVNSFIKREDLMSEFTVVRNEFENGENSPQRVLAQRVQAVAYEWHNYGKSTIGNRSDIERVPIENLQDFYRRFYQPDNVVLIVTGKFETSKALELATKHLGSIPKPTRKLNATYTEEPAQDGERTVILRRVGKIGSLMSAYHMPAASHPDWAPLSILSSILTEDKIGRLDKNLVESGIATSASAFADSSHDPGLFMFSAQPAEGKLEETEKILLEIVETMDSKPFTAEEVERAKVRAKRGYENTVTNAASIMQTLSSASALGDWRLWFLQRDRIAAVTAEEVNRVAATYFKTHNRTIGRFIPVDQPQRLSVPAVDSIAEMVKDYKGGAAIESGEEFDPTPENIDARTTVVDVDGIKVAMLPKKNRGDTVNMTLTLRYGNENSLMNLSTAAGMLPSMLMAGTKNYDRQALRQKLDELGVRLGAGGGMGGGRRGGRGGAGGGAGSLSLSLQAKKESIGDGIKMMAEVLRNPAFSEEEFEQLRAQSISMMSQMTTDPGMLANTQLSRALSDYEKGDVRYARTVDETVEEMKTLSLDRIVSVYKDQLSSGIGEVAIVGDFEPEVAIKEIREALKDWETSTKFERVERTSKKGLEGSKGDILTPDKANAVFLTGLSFSMNEDSKDDIPLEIGNFILGGGTLSSRLGDRIRQKEGLSYGVTSSLSIPSRGDDARFTINAITNPGNIDAVEKAAMEELNRFIELGPTEAELVDAKKAYLESRKIGRASDAAIAGQLASNLDLGRTMAYVAEEEKQIENLTVADVQKAFKKYIDPKRLVIIRAGDFKK